MKRLLTAAAALSLLAGTAGAAAAQPYGHHDRNDGRYDSRYDGRHDSRGLGYGHGYGHHNWRTGGRIDRGDWGRGHRVDYRRHHLRAPPRGYEWREVDGNYILAAAATGIIASVLLANH
jgi:Ni/Co efflux regulator RcnB